jgi:hypothetical protein
VNTFETKGKYTVEDFIRDLLRVNGVSDKDIQLYKMINGDETLHISDIFSLKTEKDVRQCAVLLRLLCPKYADEIAGYFLNGNLPETDFGRTDVERYKVKLLAGLEDNYRFFSLAWNWRTGLLTRVMQEQPGLPEQPVEPEKEPANIIEGDFGGEFPIEFYQYLHADGQGAGLRTIYQEHLDKLEGKIYFEGSKDNKLKIRFQFDTFHLIIPFFLEVNLVTKKDKKPYRIPLDIIKNDRNKNKSVLDSKEISGIDFSEGFEQITINRIKRS